MKCMHILFCACAFPAIIFFMNDWKPLVKHNTANVAVPCVTGISKGYCTVAETSIRSWNITTVELRRFYERFRPTLPTNNVRKRFLVKNISGTTQNVTVELKVQVTNDVALRRLQEGFGKLGHGQCSLHNTRMMTSLCRRQWRCMHVKKREKANNKNL